MSEVIKLNPNAEMKHSQEIDPATILSGTPNERLASFVNVPVSGNLDIGIWECDAYEERIDGYPVDEIMVIVSGGATLTSDAGITTELQAGDVAFVPKGWKGQWVQTDTIRKFTMMV